MRYGKIEDGYWEWVKRHGLSAEAALLGVYVLSSPHSNSVGCYRLPLAYASEDLGWKQQALVAAFGALVATGFLQRDDKTGWTRVVDFLDHNPIANGNIGKAAAPYVAAAPPDLPFYADFIAEMKRYAERFPDGFLDEMDNRSANGMPNGFSTPEEPNNNNNSKNNNNNNNNNSSKMADLSAEGDFEAFYRACPKRVGRGQALKAYGAARKKADAVTLLAGIQRYALERVGKDPQYTVHPATWLNDQRWLDEPASPPSVPIASAVDWDKACATFKELQHWPSHAGDRPGLPGCRCPTDVLARHGLQHREAA